MDSRLRVTVSFGERYTFASFAPVSVTMPGIMPATLV